VGVARAGKALVVVLVNDLAGRASLATSSTSKVLTTALLVEGLASRVIGILKTLRVVVILHSAGKASFTASGARPVDAATLLVGRGTGTVTSGSHGQKCRHSQCFKQHDKKEMKLKTKKEEKRMLG